MAMKKKILGISVFALVLVLSMAVLIVYNACDVVESPNGDYQIVSWKIDKGGFGYSGAYYIKEKGIFGKWHKLGTGPFSAEWMSETEFSVNYANPVDGNVNNYSEDNYYREYSVNDFFSE